MSKAKAKPRATKQPKPVALPAAHARDAALEATIATSPEDREAHRVYADWLQAHDDPWGEVIALALAALDEKGAARKLKVNAVKALDRHVESYWIPKFPLLEHRFRAWNKSVKQKSPDNISNWSSCQILFRWGVMRQLGLHDWPKPMYLQGLELLQHPDVRFIEELCLHSTRITDLSVLAPLQSLTQLDLFKTSVRELEPVAALRSLEELKLHHTLVDRVDALAGSRLHSLYLRGTVVRDLRPLADIPTLEFIQLQDTKVTDIEPLFALPRLREVWLYGTKVPKPAAEKLEALLRGRPYEPHPSGRPRTAMVYGP